MKGAAEVYGGLEFSGPDAVRFLNGQVTQDVRRVVGVGLVVPSCVTDARGRLQFRVWLAGGVGGEGGVVRVFCEVELVEELEVRLRRYLIADDVEVRRVSAEGVIFPELGLSERERIERGIPRWGAEILVGMLPPEAGLDETDISYHKGCYVGQEVISRIRSAGKLNRRLVKVFFEGDGVLGEILNGEGRVCGEVTSVCGELGLGFLKRTAEGEFSVGGVGLRVG